MTHPSTAQSRLAHIDVLRGIACLWVILCHVHAYWLDGIREHGWNLTTLVNRIAGFGGKGVDLFIVLSGFCLYWPVVNSTSGTFSKYEFFKRRAWRLLPAYYGALLLCFGLASIPFLQPLLVSAPVSGHDLLPHLFFLQTFSPQAVASINGSLWSLALEVQLYLAFPLLILVVQKWGFRYAILLGLMTSVASFALQQWLVGTGWGSNFSNLASFHLPARWIEFICGMWAAVETARGRTNSLKWAAAAILPLVALMMAAQPLAWPLLIVAPVCGAFFASAVIISARIPSKWMSSLPLRMFAGVGTVSYSLYLLHQPMLLLTAPVVRQLHLTTLEVFGLFFVVFVPIAVYIARQCYLLWEAPFLRKGPLRSASAIASVTTP